MVRIQDKQQCIMQHTSRRFLTFLFLCVLFFGTQVLIAQQSTFTNESDSSTIYSFDVKDSHFFNLSPSYFNESWIYSFFLNDSIHITYSFNVSEIGGLKTRVTGTKMMLSMGVKKKYTLNKEYDLSTFEFNTDEYFIRLHPERSYWISQPKDGNHQIKLKTRKHGVDYNIELNATIDFSAIRYKDGIIPLQEESLFLEYLIPKATINGFVKAGSDSVMVKGFGSLIHTYQTGKVTKKLKDGFRFYRFSNNPDSFSIAYFLQNIKNQWIGYGLLIDENQCTIIKPEYVDIIQKERLRDTEYVKEASVILNTNTVLELSIARIQHHYSYLDELNNLTKMLAKGFLGSEVVEFQGIGNLDEIHTTFFEGFVTQ